MVNYNGIIYSVSSSNLDFYGNALNRLNCEVSRVSDHHEFEMLLKHASTDIVILDLDLDNTDAISVIKEIQMQEKNHRPMVVVCSNKSDDFILVSSLNSGADNFITLPVSPVVFELKIKALLKRVSKDKPEEEQEVFVIDREHFRVIYNKVTYYFPKLEFDLLELLHTDPNKIFPKQEIARTLWKDETVSDKRTIDIHIRNIRRELGNNAIKTYRGVGYGLNIKK